MIKILKYMYNNRLQYFFYKIVKKTGPGLQMTTKDQSWAVQPSLFAFYGNCGLVLVLVHVPDSQKTGQDQTFKHYLLLLTASYHIIYL